MTEDQYWAQVKRQVDTYLRTVQTLICLDSALRWDDRAGQYRPQSEFLPGRRMQTSGRNQVSPDTTVTPDIVEQLHAAYGIVGDVKMTASTDRDFGKAEVQLRKYDDDLANWQTPDGMLHSHDLLLVANHAHAKQIERHFASAEPYTRAFVLMTLVREETINVCYSFEKRAGEFSDQGIEAKFANIVPVPLEKLTPTFPKVKFYDARPECDEHMMDVLWREYFPQCDKTRQQSRSGRPVTQRQVKVGEARDFLEQGYVIVPGGIKYQPEVPQRSWVKDALEKFVRIQRAQRGERPDEYWVQYSRSARTAHLEGLARAVYRKRRRASAKAQQPSKGLHPTLPLEQ